ncbi:MAG: carbamoyltransferase family protein [Longimicrobiales bacterium]
MNVIGISGLHNSVPFKKRAHPNLDPGAYRICQGFDAAAAIVTPEGVGAAASEERFSREKATGSFPIQAIRYCLDRTGVGLPEVDWIAHGFDYEPYRDYYLENELAADQFNAVFSRGAQLSCIEEHLGGDWDERFVQVPHHMAHAASAYYPSGMDEALIVVADGMGEQEGLTVATGQGGDIQILKQVPSIHSLGILYSVFTIYLGFVFNMDEYKVMGLAPYGDPRRYLDQVMGLIELQPDGTHTIPLLFKNDTIEEKETYGGSIEKLTEMFGPPRAPGADMIQRDKDLAASLQVALQNALLHLFRTFRKETGLRTLCMAGGVALNCTANGVIKRSRLFKDTFIQPAAGDDGSALGAALYIRQQREPTIKNEKMALPLWGPDFTEAEIALSIEQEPKVEAAHFDSSDELFAHVAGRLADGQIVGWFQGRMEFGPRALGCRSILADPRAEDMRDRINAMIKKRESFRPFAPAVASEDAHTFFEVDDGDESLFAYMLCVAQVREAFRDQLPSITHVDGSARVQTVSREENPRFWELLKAFEGESGMPILLNTSFNVKGQPIVCTPKEAMDTFLFAGLDVLVIGDFVVTPTE